MAKLRRALSAVVGTAREVKEAEQRCREAVLHSDEMQRRFKEQVDALHRAVSTVEEGERHGGIGTHPR